MLNPRCLKGADFWNKWTEDYIKLEELGFTKNQILHMLGSLQYVHDYCDTPSFIDFQEKLPKGYKWNDGVKYGFKGNEKKKYDGETYVLLPIGEDLYIRGIHIPFEIKNVVQRFGENWKENPEFKNEYMVAYKECKRWATIIRNFRNYTAVYVITEMMDHISPFLHNCIMNFWKENGLRIGHIESILKDIK